jgi:hypothetical protein
MDVVVTEIPNIKYTKLYITPKKKSIMCIILSFIELGSDHYLHKDELNDFLECNFITEKEFYEFLKEYNVKYEVSEEYDMIRGFSFKKNKDIFM